jgi:hypothetical protein
MPPRQKPKRPPKFDRLLTPDASKAQIECNGAFALYDRRAREMEEKWGIDKLPELVSPETATKYGTTLANLNAALERNNPQEVLECVHSALRGIDYLDAEATANGHQPNTGDFWEYEIEGDDDGEPFRFAVLHDGREWPAFKKSRPDLIPFTKREVGIALRAYVQSQLVAETKKHFPGAEITKIRPKVDYANGGDEIQF